jgi:SAM-dependent methyltransferase
MMPLRGLLRVPTVYRAFQRGVGGDYWRVYVEQYVRPKTGEWVLDLGCGPADVLEFLPETHYVGIDSESKYIDAALARYGDRAVFKCRSVAEATADEPAAFDLVMANGVLHHLDDSMAAALFQLAAASLKPTGRFVSFDGCWFEGQSAIARWMLKHDRGRFIRTAEAYVRLASQAFANVEAKLVHDLLRVPYTHLIMRCRQSGPDLE